MVRFLEKYGFWLSVVVCVVIYLALAFKNPFSENNLISNLEPYPDTLLYSFPAWNWVRGNGWNLGVGEKIVRISVPNTYGYLLAPLMWIFRDIRSFYLTNLLLGSGGLIFFMLAINNFLGKKKWYLSAFFGFLLATNFYFFNQAQLVMAENVNYLLVGVFIFLVSLKFNWKHLILMGFLVGMTLSVKSSNLVLGGSFAVAFGWKVFWEKLRFLNLKKVFLVAGAVFLGLGGFYIPKILSLSHNAFNFSFFTKNFNFYFSCLTGGECRNLWFWQKMVSWDVVVLFVLGVIVMLLNKKTRVILLEVTTPLILMVVAMSFFVDTEGRHIEILVPLILIIGSFGLEGWVSKTRWPILAVAIFLGLNIFLTGYQPGSKEMKIISLKKQVGLNFRHKEDPWNYLCLRMVDDFMKDKKEAYFGSFLPIYFFDAYGVDLNYLPLSAYQDFMLAGRGLQKYFPLPLKNIYEEKLTEGKEVYLTDYYASNGRDAWRAEWNEIVSAGSLEKVYQSPMDNCNMYKLVKSYKVIK